MYLLIVPDHARKPSEPVATSTQSASVRSPGQPLQERLWNTKEKIPLIFSVFFYFMSSVRYSGISKEFRRHSVLGSQMIIFRSEFAESFATNVTLANFLKILLLMHLAVMPGGVTELRELSAAVQTDSSSLRGFSHTISHCICKKGVFRIRAAQD